MATEMKIRGTQYEVKQRSLWAVALLPFITLGIYNLVWWYKINRELRDYGQAKGHDLGQNPTNSVLAFFPGGLIVIPALVSLWRGTKRVQAAAGVAGKEPLNGWLEVNYLAAGNMSHPMHLHGMNQLVIAQDGSPVPKPYEVNTLLVSPGQTFTVLVHATLPGTWAWHCHILDHSEGPDGMFGIVTALDVYKPKAA